MMIDNIYNYTDNIIEEHDIENNDIKEDEDENDWINDLIEIELIISKNYFI